MQLFKAHFSSGAILVVVAESMTAANIEAMSQARYIEDVAHRDIGYLVRVELDLDGKEV